MSYDVKRITVYYLCNLSRLLESVEGQLGDGSEILNAGLSNDMLPFRKQVEVAANFALRANFLKVCDVVEAPDIDSMQSAQEYVGRVMRVLEESSVSVPDVAEDKAGFKKVDMDPDEYQSLFALPNFFFHISMAYAIARKEGLIIGKGDFDGIHSYPGAGGLPS